MKKNISNIEASVYARLHNKAKETNRSFSEVLQYYGMERFLYRFSRSTYKDKFILKGALMFIVWQVNERRATLDIDLLGYYDNQISAIEKVIRDMCRVAVVPDGLIFDPNTVEGYKIKEGADYEGVRVKFTGFLGRSRIPMQVDVAFGDAIYPRSKIIRYPAILDFPSPSFKGYPAESMVSEKIESMISLGSLNSRMKDFYDIWLLMRQFEFDGLKFVESFKRTFNHRKTTLPKHKPFFAEEMYDEKSDRQTIWGAFLKKGDIKNAPKKLSRIAKDIEKFIFKPIGAINRNQEFNKKWKAPGPWK